MSSSEMMDNVPHQEISCPSLQQSVVLHHVQKCDSGRTGVEAAHIFYKSQNLHKFWTKSYVKKKYAYSIQQIWWIKWRWYL